MEPVWYYGPVLPSRFLDIVADTTSAYTDIIDDEEMSLDESSIRTIMILACPLCVKILVSSTILQSSSGSQVFMI